MSRQVAADHALRCCMQATDGVRPLWLDRVPGQCRCCSFKGHGKTSLRHKGPNQGTGGGVQESPTLCTGMGAHGCRFCLQTQDSQGLTGINPHWASAGRHLPLSTACPALLACPAGAEFTGLLVHTLCQQHIPPQPAPDRGVLPDDVRIDCTRGLAARHSITTCPRPRLHKSGGPSTCAYTLWSPSLLPLTHTYH